MKTKKIFLCLGAMLLIAFTVSAQGDLQDFMKWKFKELTVVADNPQLIHTQWQFNSDNNLDKIVLHRVVKKEPWKRNSRKVILMLPGTYQAAGWSDITDSNSNTMIYLANNGYDVFTIDCRVANIPDMDYEQLLAGGVDLLSTTDWTYGVFREDVKECVNLIKILSHTSKIFMSGFSRGATLMFIYANKYQNDLKGLVSLDGAIKDYPPYGDPMDELTYMQVIAFFKAGMLPNPETGDPVPWVYDIGTPNYESWKLAKLLPNSKNMVGAPLPANYEDISDLVVTEAYYLWGPGMLTNYFGGYIAKDILVKIVNDFTRYYPSIQTIEDMQLAAYDDVPYFDYDDNVVDLPAIAFLTQINCPDGVPPGDLIPNLTVNSDVTINYLDGYGHVDVMFGANSLQDVKVPLLNWLNAHTN
ncbi:MAG: hypothetical protein JXB88_04045 [Spirochaetales bacterium]|nr:hypothetical protein [Spirochaetales bacterium]